MTKHLFLILSFMFLLTLSLFAQQGEEEINIDHAEQAMMELIVSQFLKSTSTKDVTGLVMCIVGDETTSKYLTNIKAELGITEEQSKLISQGMLDVPEDWGEQTRVFDEVGKRFQNGNYKISEEENATMDSVTVYAMDTMKSIALNVYSPEQIQKMDGMILALTGGLESPFLNDRHMASLDMTEDQKEKFAAINEEMKKEREKMIASVTASVSTMINNKQANIKDLVEALAEFKEYSRELKKRRSAVLTTTQISKMKTMMRLPKSLSIANLLPKWAPDADSWKPGDPVPEGFAPDDKTTRPFPRAEKE